MRRPHALLLALLASGVAGGCNEEGVVVVGRLTFVGVEAVDESRLRAALATRARVKIPLTGLTLPWGRTYAFDRTRFDQDLKRVEAFYADRGYPDARVTAFDVKINNAQDAVDLILTIEEGAPIRVAEVKLVGFEVVPPAHLDELRGEIPLKVGGPRDRQDVILAHELALNELRDHGYPYARVATEETSPAPRSAVVTLTAQPGTLASFGPVSVAGARSVGEDVIRRQLTFNSGELYRRSVVQDTQRRLYAMALFQFVNVETLEPEQQDTVVPIRVTVAEGKHQRVNVGVGYGTEEKARVDGEYRHVNFLGGARSAGVRGRWSSLDKGVRVDINQPYLFSPRLSLRGEGQRWYTVAPAYESRVSGVKATLTHHLNRLTSWSVSILSEYNSSRISTELLNDPEAFLELRDDLIALGLDPTTNSQEGTLNGLAVDVQRSTADNVLDPTRGYQVAFHGETAGLFMPGTYNYGSLSFDARSYLPIGGRDARVVVANRLQAGSIDERADDPANVPFSKKFFLGGASSLRGWGRYEVSPISSSGLPLGGNSLFAWSGEVRADLVGNLGGLVFLEAGNVWERGWTLDLTDLRYDVGAGLRYSTPVGPIRFDYGYQLNPIEGLVVEGDTTPRRWRVHFSIGQAF